MTHQFTCSACAFQIRSDDDEELVDHVREHADEAHDMNVPPDDIRDGMVEV
jgi:predicted small metal-binding protein